MGRTILRCFLICTVLLFRHGFAEQAEDPQSIKTYGISGMYIYLNTSAVAPSNLPRCPQNISVQNNAFQAGEDMHFSFNLASINISEEHCIYRTEENETIEVRNHTVPTPMNDIIMWNMTIPKNILKCSPDNPDEGFPGGNFSFVPIMREGPDMPVDNDEIPEDIDQTMRAPNYVVVLENLMEGQVCTFFPHAHFKAMKEYIEKQFLEDPPFTDSVSQEDEEMKIERGRSLKFCPICNCEEKLGTDLDLDTIEMSEEDTSEIPSPEADEAVHWKPPKLLVHDHKCPVSLSQRLEEVISEESMSETDDGNIHRETKSLVFHAVVNKLYDEIKGEYEGEWDDMDFDMRKEMVIAIMARSLRRRRVMFMKRGARCGKARKSVDKDTVFIYEKQHILRQLQHHPFVLKKTEEVDKIRKLEIDTENAFTLHVLQNKDKGGFSVCTLSNSRRSCKLLSSTSFCTNFTPFGSVVAKVGDDDSAGAPGSPGKVPKETPKQNGDKKQQDGDIDETQSESSNPGGNELGESGKDQGNKSSTPIPTGSPSSSSSTSASCFPAEAQVEVEDGRILRMDELAVGDSIRDEKGGFSKVILFTHANKDVVSEFVRLETKGADIVLSAQHYIPVNGALTTAESVELGDMIYVMREGHKMESALTKVERVWMVGLFNPQTVSSTLAVRMNGDAIVTSAYTAGIEPNVAHTLLTPLRMLNNLMGVVIHWSWFKNGSDNIVKILPSGNSVVPV